MYMMYAAGGKSPGIWSSSAFRSMACTSAGAWEPGRGQAVADAVGRGHGIGTSHQRGSLGERCRRHLKIR